MSVYSDMINVELVTRIIILMVQAAEDSRRLAQRCLHIWWGAFNAIAQ